MSLSFQTSSGEHSSGANLHDTAHRGACPCTAPVGTTSTSTQIDLKMRKAYLCYGQLELLPRLRASASHDCVLRPSACPDDSRAKQQPAPPCLPPSPLHPSSSLQSTSDHSAVCTILLYLVPVFHPVVVHGSPHSPFVLRTSSAVPKSFLSGHKRKGSGAAEGKEHGDA